jgi:hypothetical protein
MSGQELYLWLKRNWRQDRTRMKMLNRCFVREGQLIWSNRKDATLWRRK